MAIGSRRGSARGSLRGPKFLDVAGGFYGRLGKPMLDEEVEEQEQGGGAPAEGQATEGGAGRCPGDAYGEGFDANDTIPEDDNDGETLLRVKLERGGGAGGRWSMRRSRRRQKGALSSGSEWSPPLEGHAPSATEFRGAGAAEPIGTLLQFQGQEDADDMVLIRDQGRREEEEGEDERRMRREQDEGMKVLKRNTMKNYRKALDRAFRRGWEAFVTNLYSVTLSPVTSSTPCSPPNATSSQKTLQRNIVLAVLK